MKKRFSIDSEKTNDKWRLRRNDLIFLLIVLLTAISLVLFLKGTQKDGNLVVVKSKGTITGTYALDKNQVIHIVGKDGGKNTLTIKDGKAYMEEADCPDQICVKHAPISHSGESIICLPHQVVVSITSGKTHDKEGGIDTVAQ